MTSRIVFKALLNIYDRLPEKIVKGEKLAFLNVLLIFEKPQRIEATFVYSNLALFGLLYYRSAEFPNYLANVCF